MVHLELVADMVGVALLSFWFDVVFGLIEVYFSECLGEFVYFIPYRRVFFEKPRKPRVSFKNRFCFFESPSQDA